MICGVLQGFSNKKNCARDPKKIRYWRRRMREHVLECTFCQKELKKRRR